MTPITILMPIYNDWESASVLVDDVARALGGSDFEPRFILVNDGSSVPPRTPLRAPDGARVEILHLRRNLGHQRAIAIGLAHVQRQRGCELVVVMDGDGEDTPQGLLTLLRRARELDGKVTVFAARRQRTESRSFRAFYVLYRGLHRLLTGREVREGNFSALPLAHIDQLVAVSELWNHYAAAAFKARLPIERVPVDRGRRIAGGSSMSFLALVAHGLSAISVFADVVGLRLLVATFVLGLLAAAAVIAVVVIRVATDLAIPGWATTATGLLLLLLSQAGLLSLVFVFMVLQSRNTSSFIPLRDHAYFIDRVERVGPERG